MGIGLQHWKWIALCVGAGLLMIWQGCSPQTQGSGGFASQSYVDGCAALSNYDAPQTIGEVVELINASPKPLTVGCLVNKLAKPLQVNMTNGVFSAQPAAGNSNPRIFIKSGTVFISIVPEGTGSHVVEFGEMVSDTRTIKGELDFPVTAAIDASAPFVKVSSGGGTSCAFCHTSESPASAYAGAFESTAFKPTPGTEVSITSLQQEWSQCNRITTPERCQILDAMFKHLTPVSFEFPDSMLTF